MKMIVSIITILFWEILIVILISLCGYEIEMRGMPEKYVKEITTLVWGFIWGGGNNQIDNNF
jgi:hypothetical protein